MIDSDLEGDGAFFMETMFDDEDISKYTLVLDNESVNGGSSSDNNGTDWFSEIEDEKESSWCYKSTFQQSVFNLI